MLRNKWCYLFYGLLISVSATAKDVEHVLWDKTPIHITISTTEERLIHFPQAVSIVDNEAENELSILKIQDSLYLKGKQAFENKKVLVQLMPEGEVIILTLSSKNGVSDSKPIEIILDSKEEKPEQEEITDKSYDLTNISLTRFAIQSLYSPERLLVVPEGVGRVPMKTRKQISLIYGASIEARPLISWHGGTLYVTAVELINLLNKEVIIDPRHILGNWQTATFYPTNTLQARGHEDTTTLVLVSDRPFDEAFVSSRGFVR